MGAKALKWLKWVFEISLEAIAVLYVFSHFPIGVIKFVYEGF